MTRRIVKTDICPNCGAEQGDANFCPNCGQKNNSHKPNFFEYIRDAVENLFAFDSKFYRSLGPLLWRPGKLTLLYNSGKRTSYVLPIRLFILITILLLAASSCQNRLDKDHWYDVETPKSLQEQRMEAFAVQIDSLASDTALASREIIDSLVNQGTIEWNEELDKYELKDEPGSLTINSDIEIVDRYLNFATAHPEMTVDEAFEEMAEPRTFWRLLLYSNCLKISLMEGNELGNYMRRNVLYILLLHIPIIAFLLKLIFYNRRIHYVDHFVFALHVQTALFAYALITSLLFWLTDADVFWALYSLGMLVYSFLAIKRYYRGSTWLTIIKFLLLNALLFIVTIIFILLVTSVSVILY
ncbi:MAG: DUF3667 domain-containing protein [Flavobacteriia bacterium]|nr:DUF3667 domain-containing protein [Flavobacteriia bacterium]